MPHLAGISRPSSCTPEWSATSDEDPPHSPHQLYATGQLVGPDVKARPLPEHPPPNLPTYSTPEWPATRQGPAALNHLPMSCRCSHTTYTTQPSTDESQTQSYDSYDPTICRRVADAVMRLIQPTSTHESQKHPHHQERGRAYKEGLPPF